MTNGNRRAGRLVAGVLAAVAALAIGVFAWQGAPAPESATAPGGTGPLGAESALPTRSDEVPTGAASLFQPESAEQLSDVMHIAKADGVPVCIDDVPASAYSGFLFQPAPASASAGDVSAKVQEAVEAGLVRPVQGGIYAVDSLDTLAGLFTSDQLAYVEPNFRLYLTEDVQASSALRTQALGVRGGTGANPAPDWPPNDPQYASGKLFNLDMLNVRGAWEAGLDGDVYVYNGKPVRADEDGNAVPVKVAIIDTGLFGTGSTDTVRHEDLNYDNIVPGYNFIAGTEGNAPDAHGHGTFVAGLIAGQVNNEKGVAGAMPGVVLVPEKVFDTGSASTEDVISAIYHATDTMHVDVINMSLGGEYNERSLETACDHAVSQGVLVVASAGNDGVSTPNYPAAYDSVVGVASVNSSKVRSSWSQYGKSVFVTAPGESVTSTYKDGPDSYYTASGTSFSGPEVAALAAMCKSVYPDIDQDTFKQFLVDTSEDLGARGYDDYYGYGLVDFTAMAQAVLQSQVLPWYHVSFSLADEAGHAIQDATVRLQAAEDIAWEQSEEGVQPAFEAGSLARGQVVQAASDGTYAVHRGSYAYTVSKEGYYTVSGTFKTYTENQSVNLQLLDAYETTVRVVDSAGSPIAAAELEVSGSRVEQPKRSDAQAATSVFDLASGIYSYAAHAEGYEAADGTFMVQRQAKSIDAVLYAASELRTVRFSFADAADDRVLASGVGLVVSDESGVTVAPQADCSYRLAVGRHYTARASKAGYEDGSLAFTVGDDAEQHQQVRLTAARNTYTFNVVDEAGKAVASAQVKVADADGQRVEARADNPLRFSLTQGSYTFEATAAGYEPKTGSFEVATESHTLTVVLAAMPHRVAFAVSDGGTGAALEGASIKVSTSTALRALPAEADGTWLLSPGDYRYTVYKDGYQAAQGTFAVAGEDLVVQVELAAKDASEVSFAGGSGTPDDPYLIANEEQLRYLAEQTAVVRMTSTSAETNKRETLGGCYLLVDDIHLESGDWLPIGNAEFTSNCVSFSGTFDGGGHTVSGVHIDQPDWDYQGFFGYVVGATITNLSVEGSVTGRSYVGGIVGGVQYTHSSLYGDYSTDPTRIEQCASRVAVNGHYAVGGIVGSSQASDWDINGTWYDAGTAAGIEIVRCCNEGHVTAAVGGTFGKSDSAAGGIVGSAQQNIITDCYNKGAVEAGYCAGGLVGNARTNLISTSYNAGMVAQYSTGAGYAGTAGGLVGRSYYNAVTDSFFLARPGNTGTGYYGDCDTASRFSNCAEVAHAEAYRTQSFVDRLNTNTTTGAIGSSFKLGRNYPLLSWQVEEGALLAPEPHVVEHPRSVQAADAYKVGQEPQALVARIDEVEADGTVTWAWYAGSLPNGADARAVEGAVGTGTVASLAPVTDDSARGPRYYYCVFTNTVSDTEGRSDEASAATDAAVVYVRSDADAHAPSIRRLNPSSTQDVNLSLTVKQGSDLELSVTADVDDGGVLSYQWYRSPTGAGSGTPIADATRATYDADTSSIARMYYYVEVTNTTEPGNATSVKSDWIAVDVTEYTIDGLDDLLAFRTAVNGGANDFSGQIVYLTCDIDIPAGMDWTPIGTPEHPFRGVFKGGTGEAGSQPSTIVAHRVTGLSIDGDAHGNAYLGMFGYTQDASIYDLVVGGAIRGASNITAGLLVGYAGAYVGNASIENCATLAGSSVEGKYQIGGLVGATGAQMLCVANHADVHARAYVPTDDDKRVTTRYVKSVGGVVGYNNYSIVACAYNTGTVTVDARGDDDGTVCAECVGGVAGYLGYYAGIASAFNAGAVSVGSLSESAVADSKSTQCAGAVAGYVSSGMANLHYLEGSFGNGTNNSSSYDYADYHSLQFMKTAYFANMMNTGSSGYPTTQFVQSANGVPHLAWEDDVDDGDAAIRSAEPWITDVLSQDLPDLASTWKGLYFQNGTARPIYVVVDSPDGGVLTYVWQRRAVVGDGVERSADEGWEDIPGSAGTVPVEGEEAGRAAYTVDVSDPHEAEYRCLVTNARADATADDPDDPMQATIPAISIQVRPESEGVYLRDRAAANSEDNPWVLDTAERLRTFAALVRGDIALPGLEDRCFTGQYVALDADIDLAGSEFEPIGTYNSLSHGSEFRGVFDGQDHAITGLCITQASAADPSGLFASLYGATVKNLEVEGRVAVPGGWSYGGIAGYAYGSYFRNVTSCVDVSAGANVGGIVGYVGASKIQHCENLGAVSGTTCVGGIAGYTWGGAAADAGAGIFDCLNAGQVRGATADGDMRTGAVLGCSGGSGGEAALSNNYYAAGSVASTTDESMQLTGVGAKAASPEEDSEGAVEALASLDSPETAWKLNTSGATVENAALWGCFARADGSAAAAVHLVRGDTALATYRVDRSNEAADITVSAEYATAGTQVNVAWESKAGFSVQSIGWQLVADEEVHELGTGETGNASFELPAGDVAFAVQAQQDTSYRYLLGSRVLYDGRQAPADAGSVSLKVSSAGEGARAGDTVTAEISVGAGYQVRDVKAQGAFLTPISLTCINALTYTFVMPAENVEFAVTLEDEGAPASRQAASLEVTRTATHRYAVDSEYKRGNLLYSAVALSGTYYGVHDAMMAYEFEGLTNPPLYEQAYSFVDGSHHVFTGMDLAKVIRQFGDSDIPADAPVRIEAAGGAFLECTYGDLTSLAYNRYDETGQPLVRGLPVLLAYGCDGVPNTDGALWVVFGQTSAADDNAAKVLRGVTRICVGDDVNYSQHVWGVYTDMDAICGGTANANQGQSDLHIRVYKGDALAGETVVSLEKIEQLARRNRGHVQGVYSEVAIYENRTEPTGSGSDYTDYYEGYDLYQLLKAVGVPYEPAARVQFYQSGQNGIDNSWETVNVSLGYLAGNGPAGEGDYSANFATYNGASIYGVRPMVAYGKNGFPLVWYSGSQGVNVYAYNYRGPMIGFLPQNEAEGGQVADWTATACYLALMDVRLSEDADYTPVDSIADEADAQAAAAVLERIGSLPLSVASDSEKEQVYAVQAEYAALSAEARRIVDADASALARLNAAVAAADAYVAQQATGGEDAGGTGGAGDSGTDAGSPGSGADSGKPGNASATAIAKGSSHAVAGMTYKVAKVATTKSAGTVWLTKARNASKVKVPASVKLADGRSYKVVVVAKGAFRNLQKVRAVVVGKNVTTVKPKAFSNMKKLSQVTLGASVKKLGKSAFFKTPKLTKLVVKSTKLNKKARAKAACKGSALKKTLTVKAPKSAKAKYKKVFSKSNLASPRKATVK